MLTNIEPEINTFASFEIHSYVWILLGAKLPNRESKWFKPYLAYAVFIRSLFLMFMASLLASVILSKNMSDLCETLCNATSALACTFKLFNLILMRHKLQKMRHVLKRLDVRARTRNQLVILEEAVALARKLFIVFAFLCVAFLITGEIITRFANEPVLVFTFWYPWDWRASKRNHLYAHWCEVTAMFLYLQIDLTCDTYPATCLIILSAQIRALASRIKHLDADDSSSEDSLYKELSECIKDHNNVYELYLNVQEVISTACLIQFAATGISQCTLGVYIIYVGMDPSKVLHNFTYLFAITVEIFILCYFGDFYSQANDHLTESIYASNWVDRDIKFKKAFLLLLQRSQVPSSLMAGNIIPVQITTFVKIIKTAYSVFTVLSQQN